MTSAVVVARARALPSVARCSTSDALRARSRATAVCSVIVAINDWRWASPVPRGSIAGDLHRLGAEHFGGVLAHRVRNRSRRFGRGERGGELLERGDLVGVAHLGAMQPVDAAGVPPRDGEGDRADHAQQQQLAEERIPSVRAEARLVASEHDVPPGALDGGARGDLIRLATESRHGPRLAFGQGQRRRLRRRPQVVERAVVVDQVSFAVDDLQAVAGLARDDLGDSVEVDDARQQADERAAVVLDGHGEDDGGFAGHPTDHRLTDVRLVPVQDGLDVAAVAEIEARRGVGVRRRAEPAVVVDEAEGVESEFRRREPGEVGRHRGGVTGPHRRRLGDRLEQRQPLVEEAPRRRRPPSPPGRRTPRGRRRGDRCSPATRGGCRRAPWRATIALTVTSIRRPGWVVAGPPRLGVGVGDTRRAALIPPSRWESARRAVAGDRAGRSSPARDGRRG